MKFIITSIIAIVLAFSSYGQSSEGLDLIKPSRITIGSVYWSPYHHDGNAWIGPVVYYLYSRDKCFVRASGIHNRYGGERIGRIESWKLGDNNKVIIEGHQFEIIGEEVLMSKDRVFFKAKSLAEAYNLIYQQTTTTVAN